MTTRATRLRDALVFGAVTAVLLASALSVDACLGYRKLARGEPLEEIRGVHAAHERLGWALVPGSTGVHRSEGNFDVRYGIDERGFRRVANRGEPELRIYLFGDSFTFGHGVADEDTFTSLMATRHLRSGVHVVNTGVMGYGMSQMLQRLRDVEAEIEPGDVVIFAPTSVDLERSLRFFAYPSRHLFRRSKGSVTFFPDFRDGQLVTARLDTPGNRLKALLYHARFTGPGFRRLHHLISGVDPERDAREVIEAAREIARQRGARFALVFLPYPAECVEGSYRRDVSSLEHFDLMAFFPSTPSEVARIRFPGDPHWNRRGHELAAAAIVEILAAGGVLGPDLLAPGARRGEG